MNNLGTISRIIQHIEKETPEFNGPMVEITINALEESGKSRLIYLLDYNDEEMTGLKAILDAEIENNKYEYKLDFKLNIRDYIRKYSLSNRPSLEANWRGRLIHYADLENAVNKKNFLLKSYWRIIVNNDVHGKFYTRHDIHPCFWSPGFSIAGQETFSDEVIRILSGLQDRRNLNIDEDYDYIKVFSKRDGLGNFNNIPLTGYGPNEIYEYRLRDVPDLNALAGIINLRLNEAFI